MKPPTEIIALNILQIMEFKHSTYWNSRDILVAIHITLFSEKVIKYNGYKNNYLYNYLRLHFLLYLT